MNKIAVVIPTYKSKLNINESISLKQCRKILKDYDRFILSPKSIIIDYSEDERILYLNEDYFASRKSYSDYVLSEEFYNLFNGYKYILIYQLDSFVFSDQLMHFSELDYDYIGAEWLYGLECHTHNKKLWFYGNGGFSLRKVSAFLKWIKKDKANIDYGKMILPEDMVISIWGRKHLHIAEGEIARSFSFDMYPEECYKSRGDILPFGCHAWHVFDKYFWKRIIDSYGYDVEIVERTSNDMRILSSGKERTVKLEKYFDVSKIDQCLRSLLKNYRGELFVFGAGQFGYSFINMVKETNVRVMGIIDNDVTKHGCKIEGIDIINMDELAKKPKAPVLIALMNSDYIENEFRKLGYIKNVNYILSKDLQDEMCK